MKKRRVGTYLLPSHLVYTVYLLFTAIDLTLDRYTDSSNRCFKNDGSY